MAILKSSGASSAKTPVIKGPAPAAKALAADIKQSNNLLNNSNTREGGTGTDRTVVPGVGTISTPPPATPITTTTPTVTSTLPDNSPNNTGSGMTNQTDPPPKPTATELGVVKNPGRDVTKISDLVQQTPSDTIKRIAFEQLSAIELSQVLTSNTVDGVNQKYSIISNLSDVRRRFDASRQLSIMNKLSPMTGVFTIDIDSKIPSRSYILKNNLDTVISYIDENNDEVTIEKGSIYIDTNGDLVIEFENIKNDEIAQVQINADGTIYEVTN